MQHKNITPIDKAINVAGGTLSKLAKLLGIDSQNIYNIIRRGGDIPTQKNFCR